MRALLLLIALRIVAPAAPRVVIFVLGDDIGHASVGFAAGSPAAHAGPNGTSLTPHLDALAAQGAILDSAVSAFWCTPARSSLLTGRLPVHVQMGQDFPETPTAGIPRNMTTIAEKLALAGYESHVVGKWDCGIATPAHTPEGRGFNSSLVYFEHMVDSFTQRVFAGGTACTLYGPNGYNISDLWDSGAPSRTLNGSAFIEELHVDRIGQILDAASPLDGQPLFLLYTPHIAHYPLEVPSSWLARYAYMGDDDEDACNATLPTGVYPGAPTAMPIRCRRLGAALVGMLDEIVGNLSSSLRARGWWNETLFIFSSDNGAPLDVQEAGGGNSPLRGGKYSSWQGGIQVPAFVGGGFLPAAARGTRVSGLAHMADWLATLCGLAGVDPTDAKAAAAHLPPIDSLDLWPLLTGANVTSPRVEVPVAPSTLIAWPWKLLTGLQWWSGYSGALYPNASSPSASPNLWVDCGAGCLFNLSADASETDNVAAEHPGIVAAMAARLSDLSQGFYSNNDSGVDACPPGTLLCGCWAAVHTWGGALGPYQV